MKKNGKKYSIMLRNNNLFFDNTYTSKLKALNFNLNKLKSEIAAKINIRNEYKKSSNKKFLNSEIKVNNTSSFYNKNKTFNKEKESANNVFLNNKSNTKNLNDIFNLAKSQNLNGVNTRNDHNNFFNEDTDHSSMETIRKILYSTDNKTEEKEDNINNILRSTELTDLHNLKGLFKKDKKTKNNPAIIEKKNTNINNHITNGYKYIENCNTLKTNKLIDKNILKNLNKELTIKANKKPLKSMKFLKTNNNYDYDNNDNSFNISDEFKDIQ